LTDYVHKPASALDQPEVTETRPSARPAGNGRLIAWLVLVAVLAALGFAANAQVADQATQPSNGVYFPTDPQRPPTGGFGQPAPRPDDSFYRYSFGVGGLVQYGILLGLVLLIARGLPRRETFALYRPKSWPRTVGLVLGTLAATYLLLVLVAAAIGPGAETDQGIPVFWDGSRAAQAALSFMVVAVAAPVVEELMFRGLGFSLLSRFGARAALFATAVLFGLIHGFLVALPLFVIVGLALGWLRMRTGSVYPGMLMHGVFNAAATILVISLGP
jgi:CAAX protease family protein